MKAEWNLIHKESGLRRLQLNDPVNKLAENSPLLWFTRNEITLKRTSAALPQCFQLMWATPHFYIQNVFYFQVTHTLNHKKPLIKWVQSSAADSTKGRLRLSKITDQTHHNTARLDCYNLRAQSLQAKIHSQMFRGRLKDWKRRKASFYDSLLVTHWQTTPAL